jgi:hypothetical protein
VLRHGNEAANPFDKHIEAGGDDPDPFRGLGEPVAFPANCDARRRIRSDRSTSSPDIQSLATSNSRSLKRNNGHVDVGAAADQACNRQCDKTSICRNCVGTGLVLTSARLVIGDFAKIAD